MCRAGIRWLRTGSNVDNEITVANGFLLGSVEDPIDRVSCKINEQ